MALLDINQQMALSLVEGRRDIQMTPEEAGIYDSAIRALFTNQVARAFALLTTLPAHVQEGIDDGVWHWFNRFARDV